MARQNLRLYARLQVRARAGGRAGRGGQRACVAAAAVSKRMRTNTVRLRRASPLAQAVKPSPNVSRTVQERDFAAHERRLAALAAGKASRV